LFAAAVLPLPVLPAAPALWVEGRGTPGWVLTELQRLDSLSGGEA
jgi:hypothetical protein